MSAYFTVFKVLKQCFVVMPNTVGPFSSIQVSDLSVKLLTNEFYSAKLTQLVFCLIKHQRPMKHLPSTGNL